ncbi:hypothetical protein ASPCAL11287 [Aspergillus calidoustus]|uniref:G domain-containing protein n=1 Tax=Aspergillus calidoustus TaxID=454130 RepID=A0A0U5G8S7_ASPCI|nr:hypothetical protein ASPCAL11287 [Aspergillus calidoustus]
MDTKAKRTKECLLELEARFRETNTLAEVLIILGRSGAGKSSLSEDLTDLSGYSQQDADSVTQTFELCKTTIGNKTYFIMDTPGFDPYAEEATFGEIARGISSIRHFAHITGLLYLTPITQQRFDRFDRKLVDFVHALCGAEYIPRVTFVTTFWTGAPPSYNQYLESLKGKWAEAAHVEGGRDLKTYQHGRVYNAAGQDTRTNIDWFSDRARIARFGKEMVEKNYGQDNSSGTVVPRIVRELDDGVPLPETAAGMLLGMSCSSASSSSTSSIPSSSPAPGGQARSEPEQPSPAANGDSTSQSPSTTSWAQTVQDVIGWCTRNVQFSINLGGIGVGTGPGPRSGIGPRAVLPLDPHSSVDVMKSYGLDSSRAGRI